MTRLAIEVNASRLDVSRVLNALRSEGLLQLRRGKIIIPELRNLS